LFSRFSIEEISAFLDLAIAIGGSWLKIQKNDEKQNIVLTQNTKEIERIIKTLVTINKELNSLSSSILTLQTKLEYQSNDTLGRSISCKEKIGNLVTNEKFINLDEKVKKIENEFFSELKELLKIVQDLEKEVHLLKNN